MLGRQVSEGCEVWGVLSFAQILYGVFDLPFLTSCPITLPHSDILATFSQLSRPLLPSALSLSDMARVSGLPLRFRAIWKIVSSVVYKFRVKNRNKTSLGGRSQILPTQLPTVCSVADGM